MGNLSLRFKVMAVGIIALVVPLIVVGGYSVYKMRATLTDQAMQETIRTVKLIAGMIEATLQGEAKIAAQLAKTDVIIAATENENIERASAALSSFMKANGSTYESAFIADADGKILAGSINGMTKGADTSAQEYFKAAITGKTGIGPAFLSKATGNPVLPLATPIYSKSNQIIGVAGMICNLQSLRDKLIAVKIGKSSTGFIIDNLGRAVLTPVKEAQLTVDFKTIEGMKNMTLRMVAGETGTERYSYSGSNSLGGFAPVGVAGWSAGYSQEMAEVMEHANKLAAIVVVLFIIFLIITTIAIYFLARSFTSPIAQIAQELNDASDQVATASSQVASASQTLAEGASEQASAIEETSASLEEMSSMTKQNADNASQAKSLMIKASQIVGKVDGQMKKMVTAVQDVTKSSEETGKIIKTIDEIAFQTNLLALNAAVEAARAGEAGAGFAVVADEVRNLAMRAADAAKNTANLIENTIVTVKNSRDLTHQTQDAFKENMEIAGKVGQLIDEIAAASQEQAQGIGQIGKAVVEMDKVVQQTAASAEESASASEQMNAQAEQMKDYVNKLGLIINGSEQSSPKFKIPSRRSVETAESSATPRRDGKSGKLLLTDGKVLVKKEKTLRSDSIIHLENPDFKDF